jgi:hypothetical protein
LTLIAVNTVKANHLEEGVTDTERYLSCATLTILDAPDFAALKTSEVGKSSIRKQ